MISLHLVHTEADVKQQIKSLQFLKQLCQETIERIMSGEGLDVAEEVVSKVHPVFRKVRLKILKSKITN